MLHQPIDRGNTVIVIEHELDPVKNADRIVDLSSESGENGGEVLAMGTSEERGTDGGDLHRAVPAGQTPGVGLAGPRAERKEEREEEVATVAGDD